MMQGVLPDRKRVLQTIGLLFAASVYGVLPTLASSPNRGVSKIVTGQVESQILGRPIRYTTYQPARVGAAGRMPVLYLLHGLNDNDTAWLRLGKIKVTLDKLIAQKALQPVLVVMPMAGNSWYVDDARDDGFGPVARALTTDLIAHVDQNFQTAACRSGRAIAGLSMGGFGAIQFAFQNPNKYAATISLSGSLFSKGLKFELENFPRFVGLFGGVYGTPFDPARFNQFNVFAKLDKLKSASQKPAIWLAAGDNDFPSIIRGTVRLHLALKKRNIQSELRVDNADHTWRYWRKAIVPALRWLSPKLSSRCKGDPRDNVLSVAN